MKPVELCFSESDLLDADAARAALIAAAKPIEGIEQVHLSAALHRVLVQDLVSPLDVPGYDNSAMDGYALNSADVPQADTLLPISQRISAGHPGQALQAGTVVRIFTGAPMPAGADAVVVQEACEEQNGQVLIKQTSQPGKNVRPRANDIARGQPVLQAGDLLRPQDVGLLASLGIANVSVRRRIRVAMLNTGDEIIEPGQPLAPGQIYNTNRYSLMATLQQTDCEVIDLGQIKDTLAAMREALASAAQQADLILTSGGVSVGEEDYIKAAVSELGELSLWRVRMKPGKPLAYGKVGDTPFIGLPGNPVSAFVTFGLFAMPYVRVMQGRHTPFPKPMRVRFPKAIRQPLARREFMRVRLVAADNDLPIAELFPRQGSDVLSSTVWADGIVEVPEGTVLSENSALNYWSFAALFG